MVSVEKVPDADRSSIWSSRLAEMAGVLNQLDSVMVEGTLTRTVGLTLEAVGCQTAIGGRCRVLSHDGTEVEAEVVGFAEDALYLMPTENIRGLAPGARVRPVGHSGQASVGAGLLGRVIDGAGEPLDGGGAVRTAASVPLHGRPINPLQRQPITEMLDVGVRAINALLAMGRGQRSGIFASSGVGKSVLLSMMTRFTEADVIVVGLIGERGREVKEFIERDLGPEGLARAIVVATPADTPPLMRQNGAMLATAIAEYFRDQGQHVLLLMDSLTRYAQAQREIALAVGEPPATRGFPPSVFANIPLLVERAGTGPANTGTITAFYTVLTEADGEHDPIAECARAILDGHIVLSPQLAEMGHYPAIDIEASISRTMNHIAPREHLAATRRFRQLYATYEQNRDLISVGAYARGSDPRVDEAIAFHPQLVQFLQQDMHEAVGISESIQALQTTLGAPAQVSPG